MRKVLCDVAFIATIYCLVSSAATANGLFWSSSGSCDANFGAIYERGVEKHRLDSYLAHADTNKGARLVATITEEFLTELGKELREIKNRGQHIPPIVDLLEHISVGKSVYLIAGRLYVYNGKSATPYYRIHRGLYGKVLPLLKVDIEDVNRSLLESVFDHHLQLTRKSTWDLFVQNENEWREERARIFRMRRQFDAYIMDKNKVVHAVPVNLAILLNPVEHSFVMQISTRNKAHLEMLSKELHKANADAFSKEISDFLTINSSAGDVFYFESQDLEHFETVLGELTSILMPLTL